MRTELGLEPAASFRDLVAVGAHIAATSAALDVPLPWDVPIHYVGALQPEGAATDVALPDRFVLVSFSTTWQRQAGPLQRVIDALAGLDRSVVVTTGPALEPGELVAAANTTVVAHLAHRSVLDRVDLVVTHAGHGTVLSSLTAGVPLVCMPMGRDQHDISARVAELGAGVAVDIDAADVDILAAAQHVLNDKTFAVAARAMAQAIADEHGIDGALAIIDATAASSQHRSEEPDLPI